MTTRRHRGGAAGLVALALALALGACGDGSAVEGPTADTGDTAIAADVSGEDTAGDDVVEDTASPDDALDGSGDDTGDGEDAADAVISRCPPDQCDLDGACVDNLATNPENPCEVCLVVASAVAWTPNDGASCGDTTTCEEPRCLDGECLLLPRACDDGDPCTADTCLEESGCVHAPRADTSPCEDGDPCTVGDTCSGGVCLGGGPRACDDGNPCTADRCVVGVGCVGEPAPGPCDDGDACTLGDYCDAGVCRGRPKFCGDFDACTADYCEGGVCGHRDLSALCDDGNPCTAERCDAYAGCVYDYLVDPCDDGNPCTANDRCSAGVCRGAPVAVDDGDACTTDACDVESGVTHEPNVDIPCDDGDACTADGHCSVDGCVGAPPIDCDDGNPCTSDTCDAATGCAWAFNSDACDDGDACTAGDTCAAGSCVGTGVSCDDGDACTNDWCDPASGCVFDPVVSAGCRPVIVVTSPARAARLTSDADVVFVTGSVTSGAGALTAVTIDGEPLELGPDGAFVHALTGVGAGLHTFVIEATDDHGYTERHVQSFVTSSEYLQSVVDRYLAYPASAGIEVFLGQDALDDGDHGPPPNDLGAVAELVVRGIDPVSLTPDPFVLNDDYTAYVKRLRYDVESVELTPTATGLELDARLVAVAMDVGVVGTCALCPRATGVATSPSLDLHAKLVVTDEQIPPADGEPVDPTNRRLVATATTLTVTLGDLDVTLDDDVLDFLLGPLTTKVANVMKGTVEDLLGTSLKGTLEGMMSSAVGAFRPSFGVNVAPVVDGGYALEGILGSRPQAPTHVAGGLELRFAVGAAGVYHRVPYPWVGVPKLTTCDGVTPLPEAVTLPREHAVELLLEDDVANQLVWGLWEGGLLEFDVPPALLAGVSLEDFGVTDLAMHLSGMLPPTLDGCDGALKMRFGDMDFRVTMNVLGEPRSLDVYVAMTANVALRPVDGELEVALSDVAAIQTQVDVHGDAVLLGMIGKIRDAVDGALVPNLVTLLAAQPLMRYPLPTFDLGGLSAAIPARTTLSVVVDSVARQGGTLVLAHLEAPELCESDAVCPDGTFCKDGACVSCLGQGDCVADPPPPEDPADPPVTPQYCLLTDDWGLQRCADRRENGLRQTCANDYECLSGHCSAGGYCVACVTSADCRQADGGWCEDEACVPTFSDDTACESDDQCDSLHCGTGVFERFCYTPGSRAPGEGCHVQAQCASEQCLVGDVCGCNGRHETCGAGRWCDAGSTCQDALADGHVCGGDVECASGVCDTVCVECTALPLAGCDFARQYCEGTTCHEKGGIGDDCGFDDQCFSGTCALGQCEAGCSDSMDCGAGQWCSLVLEACQDERPDGDGCFDPEQCQSGICNAGTCVACADDGDCGAGSYCDNRVGGAFTCHPASTVNGVHCERPSWCASGICDGLTCVQCTAIPNAGCNFATQYCEGATCKAKGALGATCGFDDQCFSGTCAGGVCRAPCTTSSQCAGTGWCDLVAGACFEARTNGSGCTDPEQCSSGICNVGTCVACNGDAQCAASQYCDNTAGGSFTCKSDRGNGVGCERDSWCSSGICDGGTCVACTAVPAEGCSFATQYCESTTCHAKKGNGVSCGFDDQCTSGLCAAFVCRQACTSTSQCPSSAWCDTVYGACVPDRSNGSGCTAPEQCQSGICNVGTCVACNSDSQCAASQYCDNVVGGSFTCKSDRGNGSGCDRDSWCTSGICDGGTCVQCTAVPAEGCNFASQNCVAKECVAKTANGDACGVNSDCASGICNVFTCVACNANSQCPASQHCDTLVGGDFRCESDYGNDVGGCDGDAWCTSGHCVSGTCRQCVTNGNCSSSQWCKDLHCVTKSPNGTVCGSAVECASGCCNFPFTCGPCP